MTNGLLPAAPVLVAAIVTAPKYVPSGNPDGFTATEIVPGTVCVAVSQVDPVVVVVLTENGTVAPVVETDTVCGDGVMPCTAETKVSAFGTELNNGTPLMFNVTGMVTGCWPKAVNETEPV